jgi:uncharacterized protein YndB with AHSA1/START domain
MTTTKPTFTFDPKLDLKLERVIDVPRELVWKAWTTPEHLMPWFCPLPWRTTECEIDLRPGGKFRTVMEGPAGERFDNSGCYLDVVPMERLAWTDALAPGYRPAPAPAGSCGIGGFMTAIITMESVPGGTRYTAIALHRDEAGRTKHLEMGFEQGWGTALDQLVAYVKGM